ncbi:hypothetical protein [Salisediminibacterium selenitireducens]|uniref:Uncharacterized protein n=1 Tax=Bacillus selenitireducens (strain ATCC 700615 / DSM 15326 / MLS10) TaxID=439292 RepID=D6XUN3_BACIE|nr:hypothetical protein [Salisediminibacterium selenitireducens]ADH99519.1 hypothetical protein Bsel_2015 [[Bacillus] selenitireducens MLS10]
MDHQKKQTSNHEKLIRDWFEANGGSTDFVVSASRKGIKGAVYFAGQGNKGYFIEVIHDRDLSVMDVWHPKPDETIVIKDGLLSLTIESSGIPTTVFRKQRGRVINWLKKQSGLKMIEEKKFL